MCSSNICFYMLISEPLFSSQISLPQIRAGVFETWRHFFKLCVFARSWLNPYTKMCRSTMESFYVFGKEVNLPGALSSQVLVFRGF